MITLITSMDEISYYYLQKYRDDNSKSVVMQDFEANRHPQRIVEDFLNVIENRYLDDREKNYVFTIYTDVIPNLVGHMIHRGTLNSEECKIIIVDSEGEKSYGYEPDGVIRNNWPFGFFLWWESFSLEN
jgi:hypothetical protein